MMIGQGIAAFMFEAQVSTGGTIYLDGEVTLWTNQECTTPHSGSIDFGRLEKGTIAPFETIFVRYDGDSAVIMLVELVGVNGTKVTIDSFQWLDVPI